MRHIFNLDSIVNKIYAFLRTKSAYVHQESALCSQITVWAAILSHVLIGLFFFDETVYIRLYLSMILQDGATPHATNIILDFIHDIDRSDHPVVHLWL